MSTFAGVVQSALVQVRAQNDEVETFEDKDGKGKPAEPTKLSCKQKMSNLEWVMVLRSLHSQLVAQFSALSRAGLRSIVFSCSLRGTCSRGGKARNSTKSVKPFGETSTPVTPRV